MLELFLADDEIKSIIMSGDTYPGQDAVIAEADAACLVAYSMTSRATVAIALKGEGDPDALARSLLDLVRA